MISTSATPGGVWRWCGFRSDGHLPLLEELLQEDLLARQHAVELGREHLVELILVDLHLLRDALDLVHHARGGQTVAERLQFVRDLVFLAVDDQVAFTLDAAFDQLVLHALHFVQVGAALEVFGLRVLEAFHERELRLVRSPT